MRILQYYDCRMRTDCDAARWRGWLGEHQNGGSSWMAVQYSSSGKQVKYTAAGRRSVAYQRWCGQQNQAYGVTWRQFNGRGL